MILQHTKYMTEPEKRLSCIKIVHMQLAKKILKTIVSIQNKLITSVIGESCWLANMLGYRLAIFSLASHSV